MRRFLFRAFGRMQRAFAPSRDEMFPQVKQDNYQMWLKFANAGMLQEGNINAIDHVLRNLPSNAPIVEIGSFCGLSMNFLTHFMAKHKRTNPIFSCDPWLFQDTGGSPMLSPESDVSHAEFRALVRESFLRNVRLFSRNRLPHAIELGSDEFFSAWAEGREVTDVFGRATRLGGKISFCYVDGDHSYTMARRDFENADRFLEPGGFILMDDSAEYSPFDVYKVVQEIIAANKYEVIDNSPNYLLRKK